MEISAKIKDKLREWLWDREKNQFKLNHEYSKLEFNSVIRQFLRIVNETVDQYHCDRIEVIDKYIDILKYDLKYECLSDSITTSSTSLSTICSLPSEYKDRNGNVHDLNTTKETIEIDLTKTCTLCKPWSMTKYINNVCNDFKIGDDFKYMSNNHHVLYYPTLDIAIVTGGNHSISNGLMYHHQVVVDAMKIDDRWLLEYCYTDGLKWYNTTDNSVIDGQKEIDSIIGLKLAILFTMVQGKHNLLNERQFIDDRRLQDDKYALWYARTLSKRRNTKINKM